MKVKVPVTWAMCGYIDMEVDADTVLEAAEMTTKVFAERVDEIPLPEEQFYVDGSFEMSCGTEELPLYQ